MLCYVMLIMLTYVIYVLFIYVIYAVARHKLRCVNVELLLGYKYSSTAQQIEREVFPNSAVSECIQSF